MSTTPTIELPPACSAPCNECPWVRTATAGWLGPLEPELWIATAHSEEPIACHMTIKRTDGDGHGDWADPAMRQCAGAAIFRLNVHKLPKNPTEATYLAERDEALVFATNAEFIEHHRTGDTAEGFAKMRAERAGSIRFVVHCLEHDEYHGLDPSDDPHDPQPCITCEDEGADDPYCTEVMEARPCPSPMGLCASDDHHHGRGDHLVAVSR